MHAAAVAPELAHKADHRNLWLVGVEARGTTTITFRFRIPRRVRPGLSEYMEVQRQATHAFAHLHLGVPLDSRAVLSSAQTCIGVVRAALPSTGSVSVRANIEGRAARGVVDIDVGFRFTVDGSAEGNGPGDPGLGIGEGRITGKYLPPRLYARLRAAEARDDASAEAGVFGQTGQVIEELAIEPDNPILADHETDHISGMAVVCAAERLAAKYFPARRLRELTTRFFAFIEKSEPAHVVLQAAGDRIATTVTQGGRVRARVEGGFAATGGEEAA